MRLISSLFLLISIGSTAEAANWQGRVYEVSSGAQITRQELNQKLENAEIVVLGEKHYTDAVQAMEASLISELVRFTHKENAFTLGWEFLNFTTQAETDKAVADLRAGAIKIEEFLLRTQGSTPSLSYAPVIQTTLSLGGSLLGLNLSRAEKAPVVEKGLSALDPALLPPMFQMGGADYYARFAEVMQGHATEEKIHNYFAAQCLTDDVMAYHLLESVDPAFSSLRFMIAGSFHTEFNDAAVLRLKARAPGVSIRNIRIFDASDYDEAELLTVLHDVRYGDVADYVVFVNEP